MKAGSEKGWGSLQSYIKRMGPEEEQEQEEGAEDTSRDSETRDTMENDYSQPPDYDDFTTEQPRKGRHSNNERCEVGDLLGMEQNSRHYQAQNMEEEEEKEDQVVDATHKKHKKKKKKKKRESTENEEPSLINFDDDWSSTPSAPPKATPSLDDVKSNRTQSSSKSGLKVSGGYGSVGNSGSGSKATSKDWSGDWEGDWTGGWDKTDTAPSEKKSEDGGNGWDDDWGDGWNSVDLSAKTD